MDEVIAHATQIINQQLEWYSSKLSNIEKFQLIETRDLLRQLLNCDPYRNKWIWLYGRQFERLLNQNERPPNDFWIQLHDDILFVLEELNGTKNKNDSWTSFLGKMKFEDELCNCQWRLCFTCLTYSPGTNPLSLCSCYIMCGRSFLYIRCVQCREGTAESVQMTQHTIMSKDIGATLTFPSQLAKPVSVLQNYNRCRKKYTKQTGISCILEEVLLHNWILVEI